MILITEAQSAALITPALAYEAASAAFIAAISPEAASFPVVIGHGSDPQNRFTVKSAVGAELAGLKIGAYFPTNDARGLPRHASTILLIDQQTGRIGAVIEGSAVNGYRTAAADALATDTLARPEAEVLTLIGTGHQAAYEAQAIARVRRLSRVLVVGRDPARRQALVDRLCGMGLNAEAAEVEPAVRSADILVTVTTSTRPLFRSDWVRPGTHISAMGTDAQGKQELPADLFPRARLFCDLPAQSLRIGEFQHAAPEAAPTALGAVLTGAAPGRRGDGEITIFDSSGLSLQDLHVAKALLDRHRAG